MTLFSIDCHQEERCIYALERRASQERILAVFNFSDQLQEKYEFEVKDTKKLTILIASDMEQYAGTKKYTTMNIPLQNGKVILDLEPYSAIYLQMGI